MSFMDPVNYTIPIVIEQTSRGERWISISGVVNTHFIGSYLLGAGTLKDLSLALFIGLIVSALSTLFVQAPMYSWLRRNEPEVIAQRERVLASR